MADENQTPPVEGEVVNPGNSVNLTKHPEDTVRLLESAFHNMFNITEACEYADISRETYYKWLADDDIFSFRMSVAQKAPNQKAKSNILAALNAGDTAVSRWYLERKDPEFKPTARVETPNDINETRQRIKDFLDDDSDKHEAGTEPAATDSPDAGSEVAPTPSDIS